MRGKLLQFVPNDNPLHEILIYGASDHSKDFITCAVGLPSPLAPRTESYDARIARHDIECGNLRQGTKLRLANQEFPIDMKMSEIPR